MSDNVIEAERLFLRQEPREGSGQSAGIRIRFDAVRRAKATILGKGVAANDKDPDAA